MNTGSTICNEILRMETCTCYVRPGVFDKAALLGRLALDAVFCDDDPRLGRGLVLTAAWKPFGPELPRPSADKKAYPYMHHWPVSGLLASALGHD